MAFLQQQLLLFPLLLSKGAPVPIWHESTSAEYVLARGEASISSTISDADGRLVVRVTAQPSPFCEPE